MDKEEYIKQLEDQNRQLFEMIEELQKIVGGYKEALTMSISYFYSDRFPAGKGNYLFEGFLLGVSISIAIVYIISSII